MPRQPSVPNFTTVVSAMFARFSNQLLDQVVPSRILKLSDHLAHILRSLASRNQQSILRLHHNKVADANQRDHLARRMNIVPSRVDGDAKRIISVEHIRNRNLLRRTARSMLMQRRPAPKIDPLEVARQAVDLSSVLASRRTRLKHSIVDADVLALRIQLSEDAIELRLRGSVRLSDPLQQRRHRRTMIANSVRQRSRTPQTDSCVPRIVAGRDKLFRQRRVRLLGKPLHPPSCYLARRDSRRLDLCAQFNVTVTSLRSRRRNA